jgi:2-dehydropantoate 2-reductase
MSSTSRHAILGAGGVGGLIGACLAHSGASVTLVVRPEALADYPRQLRLESSFGNFEVPVELATEVPTCDVLWITTKATQLEVAMKAIVDPASVGAIVPLLNGIDHLARLRARFGAERVIAATIGVESERVAPGHIVHRSPWARLNVSSAGRTRLQVTMEQLQAVGFEYKFFDDEATLMWSKLVFLGPTALATTAANLPVGGIASDPALRAELEACVREAVAVGIAEGAKLTAEVPLSVIANMPPVMRSSMQKDVDQGKEPELDAIAGPIVRGAGRHRIAIPATARLVEAVERRAGLGNVIS